MAYRHRTMRQLVLGLIVVVSAAVTVDTQVQVLVGPPTPPPTAPLAPGKAVVVGRVVQAGTTTGVAYAIVRLTGQALGATTATFTDGTPGGPRRVIADGEGRFVLRGLPDASYNLLATAAGYADSAYGQARPPALPSSMRRSLDVTRTLDVSDADRPLTIMIPMWRLGGLSGAVRDEAGEPMAGVLISVLARLTDAGGPFLSRVNSVVTDDRGMYHVDVAPGDYQIAFFAPTTTVPVGASEEYQDAMAEGGDAQRDYMNDVVAYGGLLPRAYGTRMGNLLVSRFDDNNRPLLPPFVDATGRMVFYPTTFHPSSSTAGTAAVVTVAPGEEKAGINLDLRPVPMHRVSGRAIGPYGPMTSFVIRLMDTDPSTARSGPRPMDTSQAMTDGRGNFTFVAVPPGTYTLYAIRPARTADDNALWAIDSVAVGDGDVTGIVMTMQPGARLSGRVVVEHAGTPVTPDQLLAITITPRPIGGTAMLQTGAPFGRPDVTGRFSIPQLVPGPYTIAVTRPPPGLIVKSITAAGRNAVDLPFDVTPAGADDMIVTLTDRITTLGGTARDDTGQPSATATVLVFPSDKALWPLAGAGSRRLRTAATGRDGRYSFRELPAGEYFVVALDGADRDVSDPKVLASLTASASRVTLADGETRSQDLRVTVIK